MRLERIADDADDGQLERNDRSQHLLDHHLGTGRDIFSGEDASGEDIADQIHGFVPFVGLNAIKGQEQASIPEHLFSPVLVFSDLGPRPQQGSVGFKEKQNFPARDGLGKGGESLHEQMMDLIHGLVLTQPELSHQQDDVQSERKAGQGSSIRL